MSSCRATNAKGLQSINAATPLAPEVYSATEAVLLENVTGKALNALKPKTDGEWMTPTLIAEQLGVTAARVGLTITELNIRGNIDGVARAVLNKAAYSDKTVTTYQYTPRALEMIRARLQEAPKLEPVNFDGSPWLLNKTMPWNAWQALASLLELVVYPMNDKPFREAFDHSRGRSNARHQTQRT